MGMPKMQATSIRPPTPLVEASGGTLNMMGHTAMPVASIRNWSLLCLALKAQSQAAQRQPRVRVTEVPSLLLPRQLDHT